ncbi:hypothetical protein SATMO3_35890 [Sporomusa aerivorans]
MVNKYDVWKQFDSTASDMKEKAGETSGTVLYL